MDSRRDFLKKASVVATGAGLMGALPASIQKALAINPAAGSTFLDAEHIVILMQENRSFDHCYGTLQGVRGFNDPRAIRLPNRNKVWLQTDKQGNTFAPFRLDLQKSHHWYDFVVKIVGGSNFERRYAGHVETGKESFTDPAMGRVINA